MNSSLVVIRGRLERAWWQTLLAFVMAAWLGQGTAAAETVGKGWLDTLLRGPDTALVQPLAWRAALGEPAARTPASAKTRTRVLEAFGRAPLHFEPNRGQAAEPVKFLARTPGYQLYLTSAEAVLALRGRGMDQPATVRMQLVGEKVNPQPTVEALEALSAHSNYYLGNDPQRWRTEVPHFAKVRYTQVYPGVDWVLYGNPRQLEYDFVVAPGADPQAIKLSFAGADALRVEANGELVAAAAGREVLHSSPTIYQNVNGEKREVSGRYVLREDGANKPVVGFEIAAYDPKLPLVIDPVIYFDVLVCTEQGCSNEDDFGWDITVDSIGNAYIVGFTASDSFLNSVGNCNTVACEPRWWKQAFDKTFNGVFDAFIVRLDIGGQPIYATYLGGSSYDYGYGIALDNQGHFYITGSTRSTDFPVLNPFQATLKGTQDAFVAKFDVPTGQLIYSTYLGGATNTSGGGGVESGRAMIVDHAGNAYITGYTNSTDFPVQGPFNPTQGGGDSPFDPTYNNLDDVFVTKLNPAGNGLVYSTFLGGSGDERGFGIVLDAAGNAYVTGYTDSPDFPNAGGLTSCATRLANHNNYEEVFVAKLSADGKALGYSTCFGGSRYDRGHGIDIDASNNVYITGYTDSPNIEGATNLYSVDGRGFDLDAFLARLDQNGKPVVNTITLQPAYFTYLGGNANDMGYSIAVDCCGSMGTYITGYTLSHDFPVMRPDSDNFSGTTAIFITRFDSPTGLLTYSSFFGGDRNNYGLGIALDAALDVYVTGYTNSSANFPAPLDFPDGDIPAASDYNALVLKIAIPFSDYFTVSVTGAGTGGGKVTSNPAGIACVVPDPAVNPGGVNFGDCVAAYVPNTKVTLTATPNSDSTFAGWNGGDCQGTSACVLAAKNSQVTAYFNKSTGSTTFALAVTLVGGGTVTSDPVGINCGADCNENYASGTEVTLTAAAGQGFFFAGWSGACTGVDACKVVMNQNRNVTATFTTVKSYILTVTKAGAGAGTVTSTPVGIDCGSDCSEVYNADAKVTLTAKPSTNSTFANWGGDCTGINDCVVTMTGAKNVTATFALADPNLPDLVVPTLISPAAGQQNAGRTLSFDLTVKNQGKIAAGAFRVGLYLSTDQTIDPATDIDSGYACLFSSLDKDVTAACSGTFNMPVNGVYYLGAYADPYNAVQEITKANNSKATTNQISSGLLLAGLTANGQIYYTTDLNAWIQISGQLSQLQMGDFNGDGKTDLAGVAGNGSLWYTINLSAWTQIPGALSRIVVGDFNNDGKADLAGVASNGSLWYTTNLSAWTQIPGALNRLAVGDFNGDGKADLAGVASNGSIWYTTNLSTWTQISGSLSQLAAGDFNGDGQDDLVGVASDGSIWYTTDLSTWTRIPGALNRVVVGRFDSDGRDDVAGLASNGSIWYTTNLSTWTQIPGALNRLVVSSLSGSVQNDLAGLAVNGSIWYTTDLNGWLNISGQLDHLAGDD